ncbi:unnamed protein product, partial [Rotaria sp. Silwood1]
KTLISLRHDRQASLAEILQIVGLRLDLHDYTGYNLPKENKISSNLFSGISRSSNLSSISLNLNDNIRSCTITSPSHFFIQLTEKK